VLLSSTGGMVRKLLSARIVYEYALLEYREVRDAWRTQRNAKPTRLFHLHYHSFSIKRNIASQHYSKIRNQELHKNNYYSIYLLLTVISLNMGAKHSIQNDVENYYEVEDRYAMKTTGTHSSLIKFFKNSLEERTAIDEEAKLSKEDNQGNGIRVHSRNTICRKEREVIGENTSQHTKQKKSINASFSENNKCGMP
jgi:hypothetical protein